MTAFTRRGLARLKTLAKSRCEGMLKGGNKEVTHLSSYLDAGSEGQWASLRMDNNDPCWIGVAQTGVLVKKSKIGMFGSKLYDKNVTASTNTARGLSKRFPTNLTPPDMQHPLLKSFTNAVLHCSGIEEVRRVLNKNFQKDGIGEFNRVPEWQSKKNKEKNSHFSSSASEKKSTPENKILEAYPVVSGEISIL